MGIFLVELQSKLVGKCCWDHGYWIWLLFSDDWWTDWAGWAGSVMGRGCHGPWSDGPPISSGIKSSLTSGGLLSSHHQGKWPRSGCTLSFFLMMIWIPSENAFMVICRKQHYSLDFLCSFTDDIEKLMKKRGLHMTSVLSRRSGPEFLSILKFTRWPSPSMHRSVEGQNIMMCHIHVLTFITWNGLNIMIKFKSCHRKLTAVAKCQGLYKHAA